MNIKKLRFINLYKLLIISCQIFLMITCTNENTYNKFLSPSISPNSIDSLIHTNNINGSLIKEIGTIKNLDILNGIHGFTLGMHFDSINFGTNTSNKYNGIFDSTYFSEDILIFRSEKKYDDEILGDNTSIYLLFYQYHLEKILLSRYYINKNYDEINYLPSIDKIFEQSSIEDIQQVLCQMFGKPNKYSSIILKQKITNQKYFGDKGTHCDKTESKWQGEKVLLSFSAERIYKYPLNYSDLPYKEVLDLVIPYRFECSLNINNLTNSNEISNRLKRIDNLIDTDKSIKNKENLKERLINKF